MARIRTIKPEFFTSEDIVELEPMARLLYIALWCEADKEGRFAWKPKTFKMRYFPADNCNIDTLADALVTRGLVCLYGESLAFIPSFKDHQHINPRERDSVLPPPKDHASITRRDASVTVDARAGRKEGREGKEIDASPIGFAEFWSAYPRKVAKGDAEKAWKKHKPDLAACLSAIAVAKSSPDWTKDGGQFIPHPATWINGKRWEDGSVPTSGQPALPDFMRGAL